MKAVNVQVTKYQSNDGYIFDEKEDCVLHEKRIEGKIKTCEKCGGEGQSDAYGDGHTFSTCGKCHGKGYLEIKV